ncbi:class I SAM-dependent methyltransferase [Chromobacterium sp. CV08]|uniref:class I SAM-dependent methyltransferase n=1 Tax=Chromobacterium sp. CV08 TaxID=3133274 RepID=UPI003DA92CD0
MGAADFDGYYRNNGSFYGDKPSPFLVHYLEKYGVKGAGPGLDLGCGQGRNALYLASCGFSMCGVDESSEAVERLSAQAGERRLDVSAKVVDLANLEIEPRRYQVIVANTSLDHLDEASGQRLAQAMMDGLVPGGYLFVSVFMVNDPGCVVDGGQASETAAYVRHYYRPDELRQQFSSLALLAYQEEYALDVGHGLPHYHGIARLFGRNDQLRAA